MNVQQLVNFLEKYPSDAVVKITTLGFQARDIDSLTLRKAEEGEDESKLILELKDEPCDW